MKRIIKGLILVGLSIFLVSCGSREAETEKTSYSLDSGGTLSTITFEHQEDKVLKQTTVNEVSYQKSGLTKEQLKESMDQLAVNYEGIKGLDYNLEYEDEKAVETLTIDYETVNMEDLHGLTGVTFGATTSDSEGESSVSLKDSVDMLEMAGYEKVKDK